MRMKSNLLAGLFCLAVGVVCLWSPLPGQASGIQVAPAVNQPFLLDASPVTAVNIVEGVLRGLVIDGGDELPGQSLGFDVKPHEFPDP